MDTLANIVKLICVFLIIGGLVMVLYHIFVFLEENQFLLVAFSVGMMFEGKMDFFSYNFWKPEKTFYSVVTLIAAFYYKIRVLEDTFINHCIISAILFYLARIIWKDKEKRELKNL